jgi:hypothetical protein
VSAHQRRIALAPFRNGYEKMGIPAWRRFRPIERRMDGEASAKLMPTRKPSRAAASFMAMSRRACLTAPTSQAVGSAGAAANARVSRSVARRRSHSDR